LPSIQATPSARSGNAVSALHEVASNDDAPERCGPQSEVVFTARAGRTYRIAVDEGSGPIIFGLVWLSLRETVALTEPTPGEDTLTGTLGPDLICGLGGSDVINGLGGNDMLFGDACGVAATVERAVTAAAVTRGNDRLYGGAGNDTLYGDRGKDRLFGGRGNDTLDGDRGNESPAWQRGPRPATRRARQRHNPGRRRAPRHDQLWSRS
jgi:hypothetical protein